jgi:hypothetical protein
MLPHLSFPTKTSLLDAAAYLSLFLTLVEALWPKIVHVGDMVSVDLSSWTENYFKVKQRSCGFTCSGMNAGLSSMMRLMLHVI